MESVYIPATISEQKRIKTFDAIRGFSMLTVVFIHLMNSIGLGGTQTIPGAIIMTFFMPLFFFISGYFALKDNLSFWDSKGFGSYLLKRVKALLICSVAFYALLFYCRGTSPIGWVNGGFKAYWFTIALFVMCILYMISGLIAKICKRNISLWIMIGISIVLLGLLGAHKVPYSNIWNIFEGSNVCLFLQFFTFGLICRKYNHVFLKLIQNNIFITILILIYACAFSITYSSWYPTFTALGSINSSFILSYSGVLLIIIFFYRANSFFESNASKWSKILCYIGRRTLDIYMIHYFFLPDLADWHDWLAPNSQILFQLLVGITLTSAIVALCLLVSFCLRCSSFLSNWLFGLRKPSSSLPDLSALRSQV